MEKIKRTTTTNRHYRELCKSWDFVQDCYEGTRAIKWGDRSSLYLPKHRREIRELEKIIQNGGDRTAFYTSTYEVRKSLATYVNFFKTTIDDIVGIMSKNPAVVRFGIDDDSESPNEVRQIEVYGNRFNDGLKGLKQRINFYQTLYGRYGLLLDIVTDPDGLDPRFSISEYEPYKILDGEIGRGKYDEQDSLKWVLLDESTEVFDNTNKSWTILTRWRVLGLDKDGRYYQSVIESRNTDYLTQWLSFDLSNPPIDNTIYPSLKGQYLNFIPFTVCNVDRLGMNEYQAPPYEDVAHIAISCYQMDSIYKLALSNHATPTLVISNAQKEMNDVYLGGVIWLKTSGSNQATVQMLETSGSGITEIRNSMERLESSLKNSSIRELLDGAGANSSGEAIKLRTTSGTAAIASMDSTSARAIEEQLIYASLWCGATLEEAGDRISYTADTSYLGTDFQLASVASMLQINQQTKTLSNENMYKMLEKCAPGVLSSYEDNEIQKLNDENELWSRYPTQLSNGSPFPLDENNTDEEEETQIEENTEDE